MKLAGTSRTVVIIVFVVIGMLLLTPTHYWGILALALKAAAMCGTCAIAIHRYARRH
jgi:hypothetical protein